MFYREKLKQYNRSKIETEEMQEFLEIPDYGAFHELVSRLVEEGILEPVRASRLNGRIPPLYNRYRIVREQVDQTALVQEIRLLHPTLHIEGYLGRPEVYLKHREILSGLSHYLWHHRELLEEPMSCKERSFSVWGREKFLEQKLSLVAEVLRFNNLPPDFLNYYHTPEPFFEYVFTREPSMTVCIIENKDTWFTFRRLMQEKGRNAFFGEKLHVLLYGEGNKVTKPNALIDYARGMLGRQGAEVRFLYFGDLDREGIRLFHRTGQANPGLHLELFVPFYRLMLELAAGRDLPLSQDRRDLPVPWDGFMAFFAKDEGQQMKELIDSGRYIPQEIVNYQVLAGLLSSTGRKLVEGC